MSADRRDVKNTWERDQSLKVRDVKRDWPGPGDLVRRKACEWDLKAFYETYFPAAFSIPWGLDHLRVIAQIQHAILTGGLFAMAMPRGSGKTTLSVRAALWALLYGHRRFVCLVCATEKRAVELLDQFKVELSFNEQLGKDHRQVCHCVHKLENNARRSAGQLFDGEQTLIEWSDDRITFPTIPDAFCDGVNVSGSTITVSGLTGALRGQSHTLADGRIIRPELVILDDPQTRESAMSASQSENRTRIINADVLGMSGPDQKITAIMPCTVIRKGDLADSMLDRAKSPKWKGIKCKMLYSLPENDADWNIYKQLRDESFQRDGDGEEANEYFRQRQQRMEAGAVVGWPGRYLEGELSAIHHAMNIKCDNPYIFAAEYQNDPLPEQDARSDDLTPDQIASRINQQPRGTLPIPAQHVTAFIDVHGTMLYYVVCGWEDDFTGYVIDYGTFPDQKTAYFQLVDAKVTFSDVIKGAGPEGQIRGALDRLAADILGREWQRDDGVQLRIERVMVDANWGPMSDTVYRFCRESPFSAILTPSHGKYVGASTVPIIEQARKPGDKVGVNWKIPAGRGKREIRRVVFDTNFWKSFVHARLSTAMGDKGSLTLFGANPATHRLFSDHLCAEFRVRTQGRGREVDEWKHRPARPDNHWLDCLVGACVAASIQGVTLQGDAGKPAVAKKGRKKVDWAALQRQKLNEFHGFSGQNG